MVAFSWVGVLMGTASEPRPAPCRKYEFVLSPRKRSVDQLAKMMDQKQVRLLGGAAACAGHDKLAGGETPGLAAAAAEKGEAVEAELFRLGQRGEDAGRVSAGGKDGEQVAGLRQPGQLACKTAVVAEVIGDAGEQGTVGGERDGRQRAAGFGIAADELGGKMLRLGRA